MADKQDMQDTAGEIGINSQAIFSYKPLHTGVHVFADKQEPINVDSVLTQDVV